MAEEGWLPVSAQEQVVRSDSRKGFQKHMVRFAHRDDLQMQWGTRRNRRDQLARSQFGLPDSCGDMSVCLLQWHRGQRCEL
jgi:hypothetical protein